MMTELTMYAAFKEAAKKAPNQLAVFYEGKRISYKTLLKRIDDMADILYNNLCVRENDVIVIAQPNIPETIVLYYAINKIGACSNLIHPFTPFNQVKSIMDKTRTKYAFLFEQRIAKEVTRYRDIADKVFVTRIEDDLPAFKKMFYHTFMNFRIRRKLGKLPARFKFDGFKYTYQLKPSGKPVKEAAFNKNRCTVLLHSGSTTGKPKTICLSDYAFNFIAYHSDSFMALPREELKNHKMLSILPSFHGFGLCMTMHAPLVNNFSSILIPKFEPEKVVYAMNKTKFTCICGVPTIYEKLLLEPKFVKNKNLKHLHCCFCGGDSMSQSLEERFNKAMDEAGSKCRLFQGYGLTEAIAVNCVNTFAAHKSGSLGKGMPESDFRVVDENNKEVKRGEIGEIIFKSGALMLGYFKDEEGTKNCMIDGYLHTGDLGYMDEEDFIFFKQRKKRVVKVSGVAVFPSEVEQLIESMPEVKCCAAIHIPDKKLLNAIKVFVVAKYFDETAMKDKILETCRKYLIRWSVPTEIEFRDELPLTMLGKVDFRALQEEEDKKRGLL